MLQVLNQLQELQDQAISKGVYSLESRVEKIMVRTIHPRLAFKLFYKLSLSIIFILRAFNSVNVNVSINNYKSDNE